MSCAYQNRLDFIADYVRGGLTEDEQEGFEAHYLGCEECFNTVRSVEKTALVFRHYGARLFAPSKALVPPSPTNWLHHVSTWWTNPPLSPRWRHAIPAIAAYAMVVVILSGGYIWLKSKLQNGDQSMMPHYERSGGLLTESEAVDLRPLEWALSRARAAADTALANRLANIRPLYQVQDYRAVADRLTYVSPEFPRSPEIQLIYGISQLHLNQASEASKNLEKVLQAYPDLASAQWYLAQSFFRENRFVDARQQLAALMKQQDPHYTKLAAESLEKLNKQNK
jgi:tetratricopeptide (TPR) repeat protein